MIIPSDGMPSWPRGSSPPKSSPKPKKVVVKEIFGSNLSVTQKVVVVKNQEQSPYPSESIDESSHITQWAAVLAAHKMAIEKPLSFVLVWLYAQARTHFISQI